jgi:hypothetical protein
LSRVLHSNECYEIIDEAEAEVEMNKLTFKGATEEAFIGNGNRRRFYC